MNKTQARVVEELRELEDSLALAKEQLKNINITEENIRYLERRIIKFEEQEHYDAIEQAKDQATEYERENSDD